MQCQNSLQGLERSFRIRFKLYRMLLIYNIIQFFRNIILKFDYECVIFPSGLKHLTDLQIHGGGWTDSQLDQLLQIVGPGLRHLGNWN